MDLAEARNKLRSTFLSLEGLPPAERDSRLRQEVRTLLAKVPKPDQPVLVERLASAFPVWPPDVPPPAPPTDEEMIQTLRMRMDASDEERQRIMGLMRAAGIGAGLSAEDEATVREKVAVDPTQQPEVGRIVDAFLILLQAAADAD